MIFDRLVPLVVKKLEDHGFYHKSRTNIQKIIYFSLEQGERNNYYIPYLYGPYSEDVQIAILDYEIFQHNIPDKLNDEEKEIYRCIEKTIEFLKKKGITKIKDLALLSKIHFLTIQKGIDNNSLLRKVGLLLGWEELAKIPLKKLDRLKEISRELEEYVHHKTSSG